MVKKNKKSGSVERNMMISAWVLIGVLCFAYILKTNSVFIFEGGDNAHYILLAKSIVAGDGYRDTFTPDVRPHTQYPPMFPLILAGVISLRGMNSYAMKMMVSVSCGALFILLFLLFGHKSFTMSIVAVLWIAVSYRFVIYSDRILTETTYTAFSIAALLFGEKWLDGRKIMDAVFAVLFCWMACMTRTAGITLAAAASIVLFLRDGKSIKSALRGATVVIIASVPEIIWSIRGMTQKEESFGYFQQLLSLDPYNPSLGKIGIGGFFYRFFSNLYKYFIDNAGMFNPQISKYPFTLIVTLSVFIAMLTLIGYVGALRKKIGITEIYPVLLCCMIFSWPFYGYRFLLPVYPLIMIYALEGSLNVFNVVKSKNRGAAIAAGILFTVFFAAVIGTNLVRTASHIEKKARFYEKNKIRTGEKFFVATEWEVCDRLLQASLWVVAHSDPDDVLLARKPRLISLSTDRKVAGSPQTDGLDAKKWIADKNIGYILIDEMYPDSYNFIMYLAREKPKIPGLVEVFSLKKTYVLKFTEEFFGN